jgi:hypothetical protein
MGRSMKSPTNKGSDRRKTERRTDSERRTEVARSVTGERRTVEKRGLGEAMVDALSDILQWERASERSLKVAAAHSSSDLTKN